MKTHVVAACTALALTYSVVQANADQFLVATEHPVADVSPGLMTSFKLSFLDSFEEQGRSYTVIDAPRLENIEALFRLRKENPISVQVTEDSWNRETFLSMSDAEIEAFLSDVSCPWCRI